MFANGHKKLGGRRAGTPNKATSSLRERIEALDPLGDLIALARAQDASPELKAKVLLELLSYIGAARARRIYGSGKVPLALAQPSPIRTNLRNSARSALTGRYRRRVRGCRRGKGVPWKLG